MMVFSAVERNKTEACMYSLSVLQEAAGKKAI
jgi:hypothetical protein